MDKERARWVYVSCKKIPGTRVGIDISFISLGIEAKLRVTIRDNSFPL